MYQAHKAFLNVPHFVLVLRSNIRHLLEPSKEGHRSIAADPANKQGAREQHSIMSYKLKLATVWSLCEITTAENCSRMLPSSACWELHDA